MVEDDVAASTSGNERSTTALSGSLPTLDVALLTPTAASYRAPFFDALARHPTVERLTLYLPSDAPESTVVDPNVIRLRQPYVPGWPALTLELWPGHSMYAQHSTLLLPWNPRYLSQVATLGKRRRFPSLQTVLWGHGPRVWHDLPRRVAYRSMACLADRTLVYSMSSTVASYVDGEIGNSVDPRSIDHDPDDWAWPAETQIRVLFASRPQRRRRLDLLVGALLELSSRGIGCSLIVVGEGDLEVGTDFSGLDVRHLGPVHEPARLRSMHLEATCAVYPASGGLAVPLSLGHGLPTITLRDQFHGPEVDLLFDRGVGPRMATAAGLADAIESASSERLPPSFAASVRQLFDPAVHADRLVQQLLQR